jgi:hypothetical protein
MFVRKVCQRLYCFEIVSVSARFDPFKSVSMGMKECQRFQVFSQANIKVHGPKMKARVLTSRHFLAFQVYNLLKAYADDVGRTLLVHTREPRLEQLSVCSTISFLRRWFGCVNVP